MLGVASRVWRRVWSPQTIAADAAIAYGLRAVERVLFAARAARTLSLLDAAPRPSRPVRSALGAQCSAAASCPPHRLRRRVAQEATPPGEQRSPSRRPLRAGRSSPARVASCAGAPAAACLTLCELRPRSPSCAWGRTVAWTATRWCRLPRPCVGLLGQALLWVSPGACRGCPSSCGDGSDTRSGQRVGHRRRAESATNSQPLLALPRKLFVRQRTRSDDSNRPSWRYRRPCRRGTHVRSHEGCQRARGTFQSRQRCSSGEHWTIASHRAGTPCPALRHPTAPHKRDSPLPERPPEASPSSLLGRVLDPLDSRPATLQACFQRSPNRAT